MSVTSQDIRWLLKDKYNLSADTDYSTHPQILSDIKRLQSGEPLAYVIGWVNFLNCRIDLQYKPLIPRPETEYWVGQVIEKSERPHNILDLCCGSGCIGIAMLKNLPEAHLTFIDISPNALKQTQHNLTLNQIPTNRYTIIHSDLFQNCPQKFNLILTNPPYVDWSLPPAPELAHEPAEALFANDHGLAIIEKILRDLKDHLNPGGKTILEFGLGQEVALEKLLQKFDYPQFEFKKDQYGVVRWLEIRLTL